jgi:N-acetylglucosaminyldiphosphoundecaprenol N-acetyl-beta-D-mannosaminyltransferase
MEGAKGRGECRKVTGADNVCSSVPGIRHQITDELPPQMVPATFSRVPARSVSDIPLLTVGGLPIAVINRPSSARLIIQAALARRGSGSPPLFVTSANGQVLSMCAQDEETRALFLSADLIHADGMPLVLASRWQCRAPLPERVATTDLFHDVAKIAGTAGATFYLLGATQDTIETAVAKFRRAYPGLVIAGFRNGYFTREEEAQVVADINAARPDILWIGMGTPSEQVFAARNRERLTNVGVVKTSGGLFDFLSGRNRRAPMWLQAAGLEWLIGSRSSRDACCCAT